MAISTASFCEYAHRYVLGLNNSLTFLSGRHVQINNDGAIEFYKKFGFEIVDTKEQYYKRIEPADAHVLQKTLRRKKSDAHHHAFTNGAVNDKKDRRT